MRMLNGDFNVYWYHDMLTPSTVRAACYGTGQNSGGLVPEVGDVINGFPGLMGEPIAVRVIEVRQFGEDSLAFDVRVTTV